MRREWKVMAITWVVVVIVGEIGVFGLNYLPARYSTEADVVDEAFILLAALAVPVFAFVVAMLLTSAIFFRADSPDRDGPPLVPNRRLLTIWFVITGGLCLAVVINPGLKGLADFRGENRADYVITMTGQRWSWSVTYPDGTKPEFVDELVLPSDARVKFDVTSTDILHSFWVPAFRAKIDAVPGRTTHVFVTIEGEGSFETDSGLRVQCAELCGMDHGAMALPIRVIPRAEFDTWLDEHQAATTSTSTGPDTTTGPTA